MKTLWLVKEPCTVWYDVKPIHEALGTEKMESSVEVDLTDKEFEEYLEAQDNYNKWQAFLSLLIEQD